MIPAIYTDAERKIQRPKWRVESFRQPLFALFSVFVKKLGEISDDKRQYNAGKKF